MAKKLGGDQKPERNTAGHGKIMMCLPIFKSLGPVTTEFGAIEHWQMCYLWGSTKSISSITPTRI